MPNDYKIKIGILLLITIAGIITAFFIQPIAQDTGYHHFADARSLLSIPNCNNVITNIPFLIIGCIGMFFSVKQIALSLRINIFIFFLGIFFTGIGSAYYHYNPTNDTLVWDRLPMTISFMAFFSIIISEFISIKAGKRLLFPLLFLGLLSILYWKLTMVQGHDDLRFYVLVQFLPMILIPGILLMFKTNDIPKKYFWVILLTYLIAKLFEAGDDLIFTQGEFVSGHSIKHLVAAIGPLIFLIVLMKKKA